VLTRGIFRERAEDWLSVTIIAELKSCKFGLSLRGVEDLGEHLYICRQLGLIKLGKWSQVAGSLH
jgi:hypothetical protein